jgi:hypothetical protein
MTSNIIVVDSSEHGFETVNAWSRYDGSVYPGFCAGFVVGECDVLCVQCHDPDSDSTDSPIMGWSEWDYPGVSCHDCGKFLDVRLLVYESGPGSEVYQEYNNE